MIGELRIHKRNTLNSMTKQELIEAVEILEHNYIATNAQYERAVDINSKLVALLNANKIEWLELNSAGTYQVKEILGEDK